VGEVGEGVRIRRVRDTGYQHQEGGIPGRTG
jgi:hypothetical protein